MPEEITNTTMAMAGENPFLAGKDLGNNYTDVFYKIRQHRIYIWDMNVEFIIPAILRHTKEPEAMKALLQE